MLNFISWLITIILAFILYILIYGGLITLMCALVLNKFFGGILPWEGWLPGV